MLDLWCHFYPRLPSYLSDKRWLRKTSVKPRKTFLMMRVWDFHLHLLASRWINKTLISTYRIYLIRKDQSRIDIIILWNNLEASPFCILYNLSSYWIWLYSTSWLSAVLFLRLHLVFRLYRGLFQFLIR
jgi:hypothetical protein